MTIAGKRRTRLTRLSNEQAIMDMKWWEYVADLEPDDISGAFLLAEEMPDEQLSLEDVGEAIATASRRALWPDRWVEVRDETIGTVTGVMRVMLPQGRTHQQRFDGELAWRAEIVVCDEEPQEVFVAYYRSLCMNPIVTAVEAGCTVDASAVTFTPLSEGEAKRIEDAMDNIGDFEGNLERLALAYRME